MEVKIIKGKNELNKVVEVHTESFANFFLTELGDKFLYTYYQSVAHHPKGILLGCYDGTILKGFCAATTISKGFNKELVSKNFFQFSKVAASLIFSKPTALKRLIANFSKKSSNVPDDGNYAEVLSIAVSLQSQGLGIGQILLDELHRELKKRDTKAVSLTTDYCNNDKTIGFYKKLGYEILYDFVAYPDRKMYRMIKQIAL